MFNRWRKILISAIVGLILITTAVFTFYGNPGELASSSPKGSDESHNSDSPEPESEVSKPAPEPVPEPIPEPIPESTPTAHTDKPDPNGQGVEYIAPEPAFGQRENATFYTLCQNSDVTTMLKAIRSVEKQFNSRAHYDWVFLNDVDFDDHFRERITAAVSGNVHFGKIPSEHWGYPEWIDQNRAHETLQWMKEHNVVYGDKESYHHMCRFQSGMFFEHELLRKYKYSWRVEPNIQILCKVKSDPFRLMRENGITYGFNVAPQDIRESITTLWNSTKEFLQEHDEYLHSNNLKDFISDDDMETYNLCHFWTNFEIIDLDFLRSKKYKDYFEFLDRAGGFFYERWGDAPIRSIAASLFLPQDKIYFFNEIGYFHSPYGHCPYNQGPLELECECHPRENEFNNLRYYDYNKDSCMRRYFKAKARSFHDINPGLVE